LLFPKFENSNKGDNRLRPDNLPHGKPSLMHLTLGEEQFHRGNTEAKLVSHANVVQKPARDPTTDSFRLEAYKTG